MHALLLAAFLFAAPYWETKTPKQWNDEELMWMVTESPWAQTTVFREGSPVPIYIATAKPMRDAEAELVRRYTLKMGGAKPDDLSSRREYELFLEENVGKVIVIAIRNPNLVALSDEREVKHMTEESFLHSGKKKLKITGHFPPAPSDPVLRLVFPRPAEIGKDLKFDLYIPGAVGPYREAIFGSKDLLFLGKPEL